MSLEPLVVVRGESVAVVGGMLVVAVGRKETGINEEDHYL